MYKHFLVLAVVSALVCAGCSDDDSGGGSGGPVGGDCADVAGTWSMALEVEGGWFGGVLSSVVELAQSDTCTVTGALVLGPVVAGYATRDSLYFTYGEAGAAPEDQVHCALEIIDRYLMEGEYVAVDGSGNMTLHGPDPDCSGSVDVKVGAGLTPYFSWRPSCAVSLMLIEPLSGGADQWMVGNENANDLESGITYGKAPVGVFSGDEVPLVAGIPYKVFVYRWLGVEDRYLMAGFAVFTP